MISYAVDNIELSLTLRIIAMFARGGSDGVNMRPIIFSVDFYFICWKMGIEAHALNGCIDHIWAPFPTATRIISFEFPIPYIWLAYDTN